MPAPTRRELGVRTAFNLLGPLTNPAGAVAAAGRRAAAGADRAGRAVARAARRRARLGRARRRRPRRDLDDRLHEGVRVPRRRGQHVLPASRRTSACPRRRPRRCAAATPPTTPRSRGRSWPASRARRATSCSSTPARRCSIAGQAATIPRGHGDGGRGDRQRPRGRACSTEADAPCSRGGSRGRMTEPDAAARRRPDLLATIVAAARRMVEVPQGRGAARRRSRRRRPTGGRARGRFVRALRDGAVAARDRRVQAAIAVARHPARRTTPGGARAAPTRRAGAAAISVLTEPTFFDGSLAHLQAVSVAVDDAAAAQGLHRRSLPDPRSGRRRRGRGPADRRRRSTPADLQALLAHAAEAGVAALVEVHDAAELRIAADAGAAMIGVNSRNLRTLAVEPRVHDRLAALLPQGSRHRGRERAPRDGGSAAAGARRLRRVPGRRAADRRSPIRARRCARCAE